MLNHREEVRGALGVVHELVVDLETVLHPPKGTERSHTRNCVCEVGAMRMVSAIDACQWNDMDLLKRALGL